MGQACPWARGGTELRTRSCWKEFCVECTSPVCELLSWGLKATREQTLVSAADIPSEMACGQAFSGEHHPVWTLGHLLLSDSYLLSMLGVADLPTDFGVLVTRYGPGGAPVASPDAYHSLAELAERLMATGEARDAELRAMTPADLDRATPDSALATSQPTLGHHLQGLVLHEGYHAGQLVAWRRAHGLPAAPWMLAPRLASAGDEV